MSNYLATMTAGPEAQKNFYPTPEALADRLLAGIEWDHVSTVLEPSAGKGDLAHVTARKLRWGHMRQYSDDWTPDIDCIEIDQNLRAILKEAKLRVVGDDFLRFHTFKRYDLIVMNPPFDRGAEHLLHALELQEKGGGVRCILNAETLRNPCTAARQKLARLLAQYGAQVEYVTGAFKAAERKTDVEVALVSVTIPRQADGFSSILDALDKDVRRRREAQPEEQRDLAKGDYIAAAVDRFNYEADMGCRLIREYYTLLPYLRDGMDDNGTPLMTLKMGGPYAYRSDTASENAFVRAVRSKYWAALFQNPEFTKNLTRNLLEKISGDVEKMADYDFSEYNIYALRLELQKNLVQGVEKTIMDLFEAWTYKWHYDEYSQNRHYFDGWCTNDAFAVNKRVIIPFGGVWGYWHDRYDPEHWEVVQALQDIEKAFDYLGGAPETRVDIREAMKAAKEAGQTKKIPLTYFTVTFYKKGTCHIEFTDLDVLKKFNLFAARNKNWLPPCYGKKAYQDMTPGEKAVVDSFEGEKAYQDTLARSQYFLGGSSLLALGSPA